MVHRPSKALTWLKKGISFLGILAFLAGTDWFWQIRDYWPRAAGDPVPVSLLESIGVVIFGLYLFAKGRPYRF